MPIRTRTRRRAAVGTAMVAVLAFTTLTAVAPATAAAQAWHASCTFGGTVSVIAQPGCTTAPATCLSTRCLITAYVYVRGTGPVAAVVESFKREGCTVFDPCSELRLAGSNTCGPKMPSCDADAVTTQRNTPSGLSGIWPHSEHVARCRYTLPVGVLTSGRCEIIAGPLN